MQNNFYILVSVGSTGPRSVIVKRLLLGVSGTYLKRELTLCNAALHKSQLIKGSVLHLPTLFNLKAKK